MKILIKDGDGHKDLILLIEEIKLSVRADSYYFIIDCEESSTETVNHKIGRLLLGWQKIIINLKHQQKGFLPFDLSDQYIGCLRVEENESQILTVDYGYTTKFHGFDFNIEDTSSFKLNDYEFKATSESYTISKKLFLQQLENAIN